MNDVFKEPNNDLLSNIHQNIDSSQSIINKINNSNQNNIQLPNINNNMNTILTKNIDDFNKRSKF